MIVPGAREETELRYKVNGSSESARNIVGAIPGRF